MGKPPAPVRIVAACTHRQLDEVRTLFDEYWRAFAFDPCFQGFDVELASLPGDYGRPSGRLGLAFINDRKLEENAAGCIALRRLSGKCCEMKRLYVRDAFRGCGAGVALIVWLLGEARSIGYAEMCLDTMASMRNAIALYERLGFTRCEPYSATATVDTLCYRRKL